MTLIQRDLYTTFCFTWGWPWRNVARRIYMSAIISVLQLVFFFSFPLSFSHLSFSVAFRCILFLSRFFSLSLSLFLSQFFLSLSLFLSLSVTQQRVVSVNQARPFSLAGPWLVLMMFPKRWRGQLGGHRSCSPLFTACRFMSPLSLFFSLSPPLSPSFLPHFQHYQYRSGCALRTSL